MKKFILSAILLAFYTFPVIGQLDTVTYQLSITEQSLNFTGKAVKGMAINGQVPGPTLRFTEGDYAVIYVKNEMDVETSIHWHGLLLPNFQDGVPYLNTPPISPGETFKFEFPIKQSGTYWYHSHTMLQEQRGVYGSIVIESRKNSLEYDKELVILLSDWTNENPETVLRFLKRGTEWYNIKKGTATPLNRVIARGALGAQLNFWRQRMESADIADIYYPAFLTNGGISRHYPEFKAGEKVRLRIINGAASTNFWMTFGGEDPLLIAADGLDVVPVSRNKTFIAIAETYDFILTMPEKGMVEFRAMAQDGSGTTHAYLGEGDTLSAPVVPRPDKIGMMIQMASMDMRMGAPALKYRPQKDEPHKLMQKWGMQMNESMQSDTMSGMKHLPQQQNEDAEMPTNIMPLDSMNNMDQMGHMNHTENPMNHKMEDMEMDGMNMFSDYTYDYLKSPHQTAYSSEAPVREVLLNLTGNMQRYIWSMNGIPLSETDKIEIKEGEITRITFNNLTMMHHPMHLHGHFFRVINENGQYSPLKHTVNVPPMQKLTIEFLGNEEGDWFFHCHILYHMMGGMARVFSYGSPRDTRMADYPVSKLVHETDQYYAWGTLDIASQMSSINLTTSNIRNQFNLSAEFGYNQNLEAELTYERYLYDYFRVFGGVNVENTTRGSLDTLQTVAVLGLRWFTPYMFNLDLRVDHLLRTRVGIGRSVMLFPRFSIFGYYEYQADFGVMTELLNNKKLESEIVWNAGAEYLLSRNFSLTAFYDNRFGFGGGLSTRF